MAWTQTDIDNLEAAIRALVAGEAVVAVAYNGPPARSVQYQQRDLGEMRSHLAAMRAEVSAAAGGTRVKYARTSKGF